MAKRIAVAVDGTPASEAALQRAIEIARERRAPLAGMFVIDSGWTDFIGNDWQSARNARQGFLDYVRQEQERYAAAAARQFDAATRGLPDAQFSVLAGDPAQTLILEMRRSDAEVLVIGAHAFRDCGRPSAKLLARTLTKRVRQPVIVC